jgi:AcrR family transcriptional regulator
MTTLVNVAQPGTGRPTGRQQVVAAVLEAAADHFAARGSRASLREIAADAGVNLGLIHRHVGSKDDLLRAVLRAQADVGARLVTPAGSAAAGVRRLFEQTTRSGRGVRILAAHLLDGEADRVRPEGAPVVAALRALPHERTDAERDVSLLAALALTYGWTVFGDQLAAAFEVATGHRAALDEALAALAGRVAAGDALPVAPTTRPS